MEELELTEEQKELTEEIKKYKAIKALNDNEGGKILVETLGKVIVDELNYLLSKYREIPELDIKVRLAKVSEKLLLIRVLTRAESNFDVLSEQLNELKK